MIKVFVIPIIYILILVDLINYHLSNQILKVFMQKVYDLHLISGPPLSSDTLMLPILHVEHFFAAAAADICCRAESGRSPHYI